jgi:hydrogenase expression/formation protein HypE
MSLLAARIASAKVGMLLSESAIPISDVANEGKLLAIMAASEADRVLAAMQSHPLGEESAIIGEVTCDHPGFVMMKTRVGGTRVVDMLSGEQLPRIC